jgi:hypothetical protein
MDDTLLQKYAGRRIENDPYVQVALDEAADDLGCFGWLRGVRERATMLELRRKDGHILAIGYAWVERIEFDPAKGIVLHSMDRTITLHGQNLNAEARPLVRLFEGLTRHRVPWVREADRAALVEAGKRGTLIERIEW